MSIVSFLAVKFCNVHSLKIKQMRYVKGDGFESVSIVSCTLNLFALHVVFLSLCAANVIDYQLSPEYTSGMQMRLFDATASGTWCFNATDCRDSLLRQNSIPFAYFLQCPVTPSNATSPQGAFSPNYFQVVPFAVSPLCVQWTVHNRSGLIAAMRSQTGFLDDAIDPSTTPILTLSELAALLRWNSSVDSVNVSVVVSLSKTGTTTVVQLPRSDLVVYLPRADSWAGQVILTTLLFTSDYPTSVTSHPHVRVIDPSSLASPLTAAGPYVASIALTDDTFSSMSARSAGTTTAAGSSATCISLSRGRSGSSSSIRYDAFSTVDPLLAAYRLNATSLTVKPANAAILATPLVGLSCLIGSLRELDANRSEYRSRYVATLAAVLTDDAAAKMASVMLSSIHPLDRYAVRFQAMSRMTSAANSSSNSSSSGPSGGGPVPMGGSSAFAWGATVVFATPNDVKLFTPDRWLAPGLTTAAAFASSSSESISRSMPAFTYALTSSGDGVAGVLSGRYVIGFSEIPLTLGQERANPTIRNVTISTSIVDIVYYIPTSSSSSEVASSTSLLLDRCTALGILTGQILFWDDDAIVASNPTMLLEHKLIQFVVRNSTSGSTEIVTIGMQKLLLECQRATTTSTITVNVSGTWQGAGRFANANNTIYAKDVNDLAALVLSTPWSLGFLPRSIIRTEVPLKAAEVSSPHPFVGSIYAMYQQQSAATTTTSSSNISSSSTAAITCVHQGAGAAFVTSLLTGDTERGIMAKAGYGVVDVHSSGSAVATLCETTCNNDPVLLCGVHTFSFINSPAFIGSVTASAVIVVLSAFVIAVCALRMLGRGRDVAAAPKDASTPFTIMFTDIESSSRLWSQYPAEMSVALEIHHAVIRKCINDFGAYEVKTMGDAFLIATKEPVAAMELMLRIQLDLLHPPTPWPACFEDAYANMAASTEREFQACWGKGGLRVRIGAAYGMGRIVLDPVTNSYDYYGTVVNAAARIEAAAAGGQVVITDSLYTAVFSNPHVLRRIARMCSTKVLGTYVLRGLDEPQTMHQVDNASLETRTFKPLRTEKFVDDESVEDVSPLGPPTDAGGNRSSSDPSDASTWTTEHLHTFRRHIIATAAQAIQTLFTTVRESDVESTVHPLLGAWGISRSSTDLGAGASRLPYRSGGTSSAATAQMNVLVTALSKRVSKVAYRSLEAASVSLTANNSTAHGMSVSGTSMTLSDTSRFREDPFTFDTSRFRNDPLMMPDATHVGEEATVPPGAVAGNSL